jgi:hypothetical protein
MSEPIKPNREFKVNLHVTSIEKGKPSMSEPMEDKRLEEGMTDSKTAGEACRACGGDKGHWEGCRGEAALQTENATLQSQITALKKSMALWRATLGALHDTIVDKKQELSK